MKNLLKLIPGLTSLVRLLRGHPTTLPRERVIEAIPNGSIGVEIGVHEGDFSERILQEASPEKLHLVDPWEHIDEDAYSNAWYGGEELDQKDLNTCFEQVQQRFREHIQADKVQLHRKRSVEAVSEFQNGSLGWVYIGSRHMYKSVITSIRLY